MKTNSKNKIILWTIFILIVVAGFGLGKVEKANAGYCVFTEVDSTNGSTTFLQTFEEKSKDKCISGQDCPNKSYQNKCSYTEDKDKIAELESQAKKDFEASGLKTNAIGKLTNDDLCPGVDITTGIISWINCILAVILRALGVLLTVAATLFQKVIDTDVFDQILGKNKIIYEMWGFVRDMLNVAFILALLFSAFCTVFQISKYSYKNLLTTIIIMALLVNFSFPIARVIIDFSNVIMYYLINGMGIASKADSFFAEFSKASDIHNIINPTDVAKADTAFLFMSVIFIFIFAVTLLIIGALLLIRVVVLAVLVIFASIAFVGSVVPFLSSQASKWWDMLFKYCFFGPIMVFMLVVASKMMSETTTLKSAFSKAASGQADQNVSNIAAMAFFFIPIIILWVGIGTAQTMSIAGASAVVGRGQKFMKWVGGGALNAGKWATYKGAWWGVKKTGAPGAVKQRWDQYKKEGWLGSERTAQREARKAAWLGVKGAEEKDMKRRAEEYKKQHMTVDELKSLAIKGDAAAAHLLAENKDIDQDTYEKFIANNKNTSIHKAVNQKVKQNRADIVALYTAKQKRASLTKEDVDKARSEDPDGWRLTDNQIKDNLTQKEATNEIGKLTAEKWADQDWVQISKMPDGTDKDLIINAAKESFSNMPESAKAELRKRISPNNVSALRDLTKISLA